MVGTAVPDYSRAALAQRAAADPWAVHAQLAAGDPDTIIAAARCFRRAGAYAAEATEFGLTADRTVGAACTIGGREVFDASASVVRRHALLGRGGENMELIARSLLGIAATLADATRRSAARVISLESDLGRIVALRNTYFATNADALTPLTVAAAEQRFHRMAVDATRSAATAIQADIRDYNALLANRTIQLQAFGFLAGDDPDREDGEAPPSPATDDVDEAIADGVDGLGRIVTSIDAAGDAIIGSLTRGLHDVGQAIGGPAGEAISRTAHRAEAASRAADDVIGEIGVTLGDTIGGETGSAVSDAADRIAGDQAVPGTYTGDLVGVDTVDAHADRLAEHLNGQSRVAFAGDPIRREFDVVSDEYIGQAKPGGTQISKDIRDQAKATFEAARETGRSVYYHFEGGPPQQDVIRALGRYSDRYGVPVTIDWEPL